MPNFADADTRCKDCVKLLCGVAADPERHTICVKTDYADTGHVTRPDRTRLWLRHIGRTSGHPTRQATVGSECRGATHLCLKLWQKFLRFITVHSLTDRQTDRQTDDSF